MSCFFSMYVWQLRGFIYWKRMERLAESSSTLTLVRFFHWLISWYETYTEYPRKILYPPEYTKIISYESYVFTWLYSQRINGVLILFFLCHCSSALFPFIFRLLLVLDASGRFTAFRTQWSFATYIFSVKYEKLYRWLSKLRNIKPQHQIWWYYRDLSIFHCKAL